MGLTDRHITNIFVYLSPKFINYAMGFLTIPVLTRLVAPSDYGIVAMTTVFASIAVALFTAGLNSAAQRYYFEYRSDPAVLKTFFFSVRIFLYAAFVISALIVYLLRAHISVLFIGNDTYGTAMFVAYVTAYFGFLNSFYLNQYQNMEKAKFFAQCVGLQGLLNPILTIIIVWFFARSYMGLLYGVLAGSVVVWTMMFIDFNRYTGTSFNTTILKDNLLYGLQTVPKSFSGFINKFFDKFMLNRLLSLSAVGVYNIGQNIGNYVFSVMAAIWSSFQPVYYADIFERGAQASRDVGRIYTIFSFLALIPLLLCALFAEELIRVMAPPAYYGAINVILIMLGAQTTNVLGMYIGVQYAYAKRPFYILPVTIAGTLANVGANIFLIPRYGLTGAAAAVFISYVVTNLLLIIVGQRLYRIAFEWWFVVWSNLTVYAAIAAMLYGRYAHPPYFSLVAVKIVCLAAFVFIGVKAGIISRKNIERMKRIICEKLGMAYEKPAV